MGGSVDTKFVELRAELDKFEFRHVLCYESLDLVFQLFTDWKRKSELLVKVTHKADYFEKISQELEDGVEPFKQENVRLIKENCQLRVAILRAKENAEEIVLGSKCRLRDLESENEDLKLLVKQFVRKTKTLELDLFQKTNKIGLLQDRNSESIVVISEGTKKHYGSRKQKMDITSSVPFICPHCVRIKNYVEYGNKYKDPTMLDYAKLSDSRIEALQIQNRNLKTNQTDLTDMISFLEKKVVGRDSEIDKLKGMIEVSPGGLKTVSRHNAKESCFDRESQLSLKAAQMQLDILQSRNLQLEKKLQASILGEQAKLMNSIKFSKENNRGIFEYLPDIEAAGYPTHDKMTLEEKVRLLEAQLSHCCKEKAKLKLFLEESENKHNRNRTTPLTTARTLQREDNEVANAERDSLSMKAILPGSVQTTTGSRKYKRQNTRDANNAASVLAKADRFLADSGTELSEYEDEDECSSYSPQKAVSIGFTKKGFQTKTSKSSSFRSDIRPPWRAGTLKVNSRPSSHSESETRPKQQRAHSKNRYSSALDNVTQARANKSDSESVSTVPIRRKSTLKKTGFSHDKGQAKALKFNLSKERPGKVAQNNQGKDEVGFHKFFPADSPDYNNDDDEAVHDIRPLIRSSIGNESQSSAHDDFSDPVVSDSGRIISEQVHGTRKFDSGIRGSPLTPDEETKIGARGRQSSSVSNSSYYENQEEHKKDISDLPLRPKYSEGQFSHARGTARGQSLEKEFISLNTDSKVLNRNKPDIRVELDKKDNRVAKYQHEVEPYKADISNLQRRQKTSKEQISTAQDSVRGGQGLDRAVIPPNFGLKALDRDKDDMRTFDGNDNTFAKYDSEADQYKSHISDPQIRIKNSKGQLSHPEEKSHEKSFDRAIIPPYSGLKGLDRDRDREDMRNKIDRKVNRLANYQSEAEQYREDISSPQRPAKNAEGKARGTGRVKSRGGIIVLPNTGLKVLDRDKDDMRVELDKKDNLAKYQNETEQYKAATSDLQRRLKNAELQLGRGGGTTGEQRNEREMVPGITGLLDRDKYDEGNQLARNDNNLAKYQSEAEQCKGNMSELQRRLKNAELLLGRSGETTGEQRNERKMIPENTGLLDHDKYDEEIQLGRSDNSLAKYQNESEQYKADMSELQRRLKNAEMQLSRGGETAGGQRNEREMFIRNTGFLDRDKHDAGIEFGRNDNSLAKYQSEAEQYKADMSELQRRLKNAELLLGRGGETAGEQRNEREMIAGNNGLRALDRDKNDTGIELDRKNKSLAKYQSEAEQYKADMSELQRRLKNTELQLSQGKEIAGEQNNKREQIPGNTGVRRLDRDKQDTRIELDRSDNSLETYQSEAEQYKADMSELQRRLKNAEFQLSQGKEIAGEQKNERERIPGNTGFRTLDRDKPDTRIQLDRSDNSLKTYQTDAEQYKADMSELQRRLKNAELQLSRAREAGGVQSLEKDDIFPSTGYRTLDRDENDKQIELDRKDSRLAKYQNEVDKYKAEMSNLQRQINNAELQLSHTGETDREQSPGKPIISVKTGLKAFNEDKEDMRIGLDRDSNPLAKYQSETQYKINISNLKPHPRDPKRQLSHSEETDREQNLERGITSASTSSKVLDRDKPNIRIDSDEKDNLLAKYQSEAEQYKTQISDLQFRLKNAERQLSHGETAREGSLEREIISLNAGLRALDRDKDNMRIELDRKDTRLAKYQSEVEQYKTDISNLQFRLKNSELQISRPGETGREQSLEKEIVFLKSGLKALDRDKDDMRIELDRKDNRLAKLQSETDQSKTEISNLQFRLKNAELHLSNTGETGREQSLEREIAFLKSGLKALDRDKDDMRIELDRKDNSLAKYQGEAEQYKTEISNLQFRLKNSELQLSRSGETAHDQERETVLLRRQLDSLRRDLEIIRRERDDGLNELRRITKTQSIEEFERRSISSELDKRNKEADELKKQLQKYIDEVRRIEDLLMRKEEEYDLILEQYSTLTEEYTSLESQRNSLERDALTIRKEVRETAGQNATLKSKITTQSSLVKSYEDEIDHLTQQIAGLETQLNSLTNAEKNLRDESSSTRDYCLKLEANLDKTRLELANTTSSQKKLDAENRQLRSQLEQMEVEITLQTEGNKNLEELVGKTREKEFDVQRTVQDLRAERDEQSRNSALLNVRIESINQEVSKYRLKCTELQTDLERSRRQLFIEKNERENALGELRRLQDQLNTSSTNFLLTSSASALDSTSRASRSVSPSPQPAAIVRDRIRQTGDASGGGITGSSPMSALPTSRSYSPDPDIQSTSPLGMSTARTEESRDRRPTQE